MMDTKELLEDYISYHYVEGNISKEQMIKMQESAKQYLKELESLTESAPKEEEKEEVCICSQIVIAGLSGYCPKCKTDWI